MTDVSIGGATVIDGMMDTTDTVIFGSIVARGKGNPADLDDADAVFALGDASTMTDVLIGGATVTVTDGVGDTTDTVTFGSVVARGRGNPADLDDAALFALGDATTMTDVLIGGATGIDGVGDTT